MEIYANRPTQSQEKGQGESVCLCDALSVTHKDTQGKLASTDKELTVPVTEFQGVDLTSPSWIWGSSIVTGAS